MSKYYKAEDVIAFLNLHCPKDMWEYQIADLPTIDMVECDECLYKNECMKVVRQIDGTWTWLNWCSFGERIKE